MAGCPAQSMEAAGTASLDKGHSNVEPDRFFQSACSGEAAAGGTRTACSAVVLHGRGKQRHDFFDAAFATLRTDQLAAVLTYFLQNLELILTFRTAILVYRHFQSSSISGVVLIDGDSLVRSRFSETSHLCDIHVFTPILGNTYLITTTYPIQKTTSQT